MTTKALELTSPPSSDAGSILAVIERVAADTSVPVERMEALLAMQERISAKQAETDFNLAMGMAQADMTQISADAHNPQTRSRYATYSKLDKALRPIYTRHGFALSFDTGDAPGPDVIRVLCHVSHRGGHSRTYKIDMPADGKGAKGGDVMTKTHAAGAAMSYGSRYLLKAIFNVAVGEEDDDGNLSQRGPTIATEQIAALETLMSEVGVIGERRARALAAWRVAKLDEIATKDYDAIVKQLEGKRK